MNFEEKFANNLKALRKKHNITQKELADMLGCSEKAVSKWECARSLPNIELLFATAKALKTNIESLFTSNDSVYLLGIDGGGTKTHLALADTNGKLIREIFADCCNPIDIGLDCAQQILKDAIYEICADIPCSSVVCFAGIAGGTSGNMKKSLENFFSEFGFRAVTNDTDNKNIIAAGLGEQDGITLILGTGVCSFLQKNGKYSVTGGKGYLIDNGGSGYNIGRDALNAYFCEKDGIGAHTKITQLIEESDGYDPQLLIGKIYEGGKKFIASFSRFVYSAASKGDEVALGIIKRNMQEAAKFVLANAQKLDQKTIPLILAGGLTNEPLTIKYLTEVLKDSKRFDIKVLDCAPVHGAIMLAQKLYKKQRSINKNE